MRPILETSRLLLREMTQNDLDFIAALLADPEVMRFYPKCYSREEAAQWIERQTQRYKLDGHGLWLVVEKQSNEPIGQVGLAMQTVDNSREPEIGYLIHRPYWRQGFASEAAQGVKRFAFETRQYPYVISLVRPVNIPSQRTAMSIGMRPQRLTKFADLDHLVFMVERA